MRKLPRAGSAGPPVRRAARLFALAVAGGALLAGAMGCEINTAPEAPRWETEFNVPLLNRMHLMDELIGENGVLLATGETGLLGFRVEGDTMRATVGDSLNMEPFQGSFRDSLGEFAVRDPGEQRATFRLGVLWPPAEALHGTSAIIDPFNFNGLEASLSEFGTFVSVTLAAGTLTATLVNDTQVPLTVDQLDLVDEGTGDPVVTLSFPSPIAPAASDSRSADLAGAVFSNRLRARVSGSSPGSGGTVLVDANASLEVRGGLAGLSASAATAQIPATDFGFEDGLDLPPDMIVEQATLATGTLDLDVASQIPLGAHVVATFPEITAPGGAPLAIAFDVTELGTTSRTVDLAGYRLAPAPPAGDEPQQLAFVVDARTVDSGSQAVAVSARDSLHVEAAVSALVLEEVRGVLTATTVAMPSTHTDMGLPEDLGDLEEIELQQASLELVILTTVQFPLDLNLTIRGRGHDGLERQLPVNGSFPAGSGTGRRELRLGLDETNSDILDFLNALPEEVEMGGQAILGDGVATATARRTDSLEGIFSLSTALKLALSPQTLKPEPAGIEIKPKDGRGPDADREGDGTSLSGDVTQYLVEGGVHFTVESHIPIGLSVVVKLGTDSAAVYDDPQVTLGPVTVAAGTVDPITGLVTAAQTSASDLTLTGADLDLFKNDTGTTKRVYMGTEMVLPGTDGQAVGLRASDYVRLSAMAHLRTVVDPADWGD